MTASAPISARVAKDLLDLDESLSTATELVKRGREAYERDVVVQLAFEALSNRIGEAIKRLARQGWTDSRPDVEWAGAARNRDFLVHHYDLIDLNLLWSTMAVDLPRMHAALAPSIAQARSLLEQAPPAEPPNTR